jgi:hypothetical protein
MKLLCVSAMALSFAAVAAEDENFKVEGKVVELQGVVESKTAFRVTLDKAPPLCGKGGATYAYVGEKDDNFTSIVELLLLAKNSKAPVMLVSRKDGESHCKLISVTVR